MNEFDIKAAGWDFNPMHRERSEAVAKGIIASVPLSGNMTALEYGAGTGMTSFLLKKYLKEITLMDNSVEMLKMMNEKIRNSGALNLKTIFFDLEKDLWNINTFDLIITQMVLHHIDDIYSLIRKFYKLLNPGGYLAVADLYPEDGSFHGDGFAGHKGFDPAVLSVTIKENNFMDVDYKKCFTIKKQLSESETKQFDVFLLTAKKSS